MTVTGIQGFFHVSRFVWSKFVVKSSLKVPSQHKIVKILPPFSLMVTNVMVVFSYPVWCSTSGTCILTMSSAGFVNADTTAGVREAVFDEHAGDDQRTQSTGAPAAGRILTVRHRLIANTLYACFIFSTILQCCDWLVHHARHTLPYLTDSFESSWMSVTTDVHDTSQIIDVVCVDLVNEFGWLFYIDHLVAWRDSLPTGVCLVLENL